MLGILIVLLVIGVVFFVRNSQHNYQNQDSSQNSNQIAQQKQQNQDSRTNTQDNQQTTDSSKIPLTELSKHNSKDDCWIAYNGKVYDITSYLPRHPGSSAKIEPYCGSATEFKNAFENKHGTSKVSTLMRVGTFIGDFDVMGNI